jgi:hypothetical protein
MANQTEYIFEKDFWGNWKLVPKKQDNGIGWLIVLLIVVVIVCLAIITLPLWIALLGFKMVKTKRYYAGIGSLLALLYFIIDIQNRWITGFLFLGYNDSAGKFTEGLIGEKQIMYVYVVNGIGVLLGLYFIVQAYLLNKEKNALNNSTSGNETSSDTSQSTTDFSISNSKPKNSSNQVNLVLGILGVVFAIAVIYFSFNKQGSSEVEKSTNILNQTPTPSETIEEQKTEQVANNSSFETKEIIDKDVETDNMGEQIDNYIKYSDVCIKDLNTNSYWYIAPDKSFSFEEANNFASNINERNLNWRIPTFDEIKNLYNSDYTAGEGFFINNEYYPAKIHNVFNSIGSGSWFWVSDRNNNSSKAYAINLHEGIRINFDSQNPKYPVHLLLISK